jgi:hypothetical protein
MAAVAVGFEKLIAIQFPFIEAGYSRHDAVILGVSADQGDQELRNGFECSLRIYQTVPVRNFEELAIF